MIDKLHCLQSAFEAVTGRACRIWSEILQSLVGFGGQGRDAATIVETRVFLAWVTAHKTLKDQLRYVHFHGVADRVRCHLPAYSYLNPKSM